MPPESHRASRRTRVARLLLVSLFVLLRVGDLILLRFSFWPGNPAPFTKGIVMGGMLVSTILFVMIWRRQMWARYMLMGLNWLIVVVYCASALMLLDSGLSMARRHVGEMALALVIYLAVNATVALSGRIHRLASAAGVGG